MLPDIFYIQKEVHKLQQKVEQLENIRKEAIEWVEHNQYYFPRPNDLLNILNKGRDK